MRDYRFDFANGTTDLVETFAVRCGYVRYYELISGGGVDQRIRVESMGGGWAVVLRPGQGFRLPAEETAGVVITNISGSAMAGTLKLGPRDWQFEDQRLIGEVSVVDGGRARTLAGIAFVGVAFGGAVAAQHAQAQLWNPAGSGRSATVSQIVVQSTSAWFAGVAIGSSAFTNSSGNAVCKRSGGSASNAQLRTQNSPSLPGGSGVLLSGSLNETAYYKLTEPIVLLPGFGLNVTVTNAQNTDLGATFEFVEEPI